MLKADIELKGLVNRHLEKWLAAARDLDAPIRQYNLDVTALQHQIAQADVCSPVSGIVYDMNVRPAEPLLYLIPQDRPLIVVMQVEPRHIDQVALGQKVKLRLSVLDQRTTPEVWGRITQPLADAIRDEATGAPFYRAEMVLTADELERRPAFVTLLPGMPVEAFRLRRSSRSFPRRVPQPTRPSSGRKCLSRSNASIGCIASCADHRRQAYRATVSHCG